MVKSQLQKWSLLWEKSEYKNGIYYGKKAPRYIWERDVRFGMRIWSNRARNRAAKMEITMAKIKKQRNVEIVGISQNAMRLTLIL